MKKITALFIAVCLLISCGAVFAADGAAVQAKWNRDTFAVEVSGSGFSGMESVFLVIAPKDIPLRRVVQHNEFVYSEQPITDSNGSFLIHAMLKAGTPTGEYTLHAVDQRDGGTVTADFFYKSAADYADLLIRFNEDVTSAGEMENALDTYGHEVLTDMEAYEKTPAAKHRVAELLFTQRGAAFGDVTDLRRGFQTAVLLGVLPYAENPADMIEKYRGVLKAEAADAFLACTDAQQAAAGSYFKSKTFRCTEELETALPEAAFVGKANTAKTAGELQTLFINEYASALSLDMTDYHKITDKTRVFSSLIALTAPRFSGFSDAAAKFYTAAKTVYSEQQSGGADNGHGGGTGGSSGGGVSGGGSYMPSANQNQTTNAPNQTENGQNQTETARHYHDLESVAWAVTHINKLTDIGVLSGDGTGVFRPNDPVTRAEFVKMIVTAFSVPMRDVKTSFSDVPEDAWFAPYIAAAADCGIVTGVTATEFDTDAMITRQDLTVLCSRAAAWAAMTLREESRLVPRDLDQVADYAKSAVSEFYAANIIGGDESGAFWPVRSATRAEAAKIVSGLLAQKEGY